MAIRESESQTSGDFSSVFSMALTSRSLPNPYCHSGGSIATSRWPNLSGRTSFWTKYCLLCTLCGTAATILAGIFLIVAALLRYHTTSIHYFETVPTYLPSILLSICGVSTIAFSCKRNRNIILLRITACWSLVSAALSSVITITTSLIHMNRLQTLKECVYTRNPPSCTCFGHFNGMDGGSTGTEPHHFVFENTSDCDVIHGVLYSCLRAVFAISVVAVLLSIFLCMLLHQLIGHERKKAYWSRIRRINSDWSSDFLSCLARPLPNDRSILPLIASTSRSTGLGLPSSCSMIAIAGHHSSTTQWGPPPPYQPSDPSRDLNAITDLPRSRSSLRLNSPRSRLPLLHQISRPILNSAASGQMDLNPDPSRSPQQGRLMTSDMLYDTACSSSSNQILPFAQAQVQKMEGVPRGDKRILYIFDFDRTLVRDNSEDMYNDFLTNTALQELIADERNLNDWTVMCRAILVQLKANNVKVEEIIARARLLEFIPGMDTLLQKVFVSTVQNGRNHLVILSGSNDLVIATLLSSLTPPVIPNLIMANHLHFSPDDNYLVFDPYHPTPLSCPFCPPILCKGAAMDSYVQKEGPFDLVYYTGDGGNDVCAAVRLRKQDVLFVRSGYTLEAALRAGTYNNIKIRVIAKVIYFSDPKTIEKHMEIFNNPKSTSLLPFPCCGSS